MESKGQALMVIHSYCLVIHLHVIEDGFFVAQMIVVFHLAIGEQVVRGNVLLLLVILIIIFLPTTDDPTILGGAAIGGGRCLLLELELGISVAKGGGGELILLRSRDQVLFR